MKLLTHQKIGKPQHMTLEPSPFVVFLTKYVEMRIEKGDTLKAVAKEVHKYWGVMPTTSLEIAACWFALGERLARGNPDVLWSKSERTMEPGRRYLMGRPRR